MKGIHANSIIYFVRSTLAGTVHDGNDEQIR